MDQNSNVSLQVVQVEFPIKYGPKTPMVNLIFNYWSKRSEIVFSYVFRYTIQSNLLLELNLDLGKCPKKKICTFTSMPFLVRGLPKVQIQFWKQIWLKSIPKYMIKFCSRAFWSRVKKRLTMVVLGPYFIGKLPFTM